MPRVLRWLCGAGGRADLSFLEDAVTVQTLYLFVDKDLPKTLRIMVLRSLRRALQEEPYQLYQGSR